jgi:hypothetical protein
MAGASGITNGSLACSIVDVYVDVFKSITGTSRLARVDSQSELGLENFKNPPKITNARTTTKNCLEIR